MFWAFVFLFGINSVGGIFVWLALRRVQAHLRASPEAAELIAKHVIAPILSGSEPEPKVKKSGGTLV